MHLRRALAAAAAALATALPFTLPAAWAQSPAPLQAQAQAQAQPADSVIVEAREALKKRDRVRLAALRQAAAGHPLAMWPDYWELSNRLADAQQSELDAFYARWSGTYVEDRLRNDWLLELGRRRDWVNFRRDFPAFRMNDDREVTCYRLLTEHLAGQDVRESARATWYAQRDVDDGCQLLASTLVQARQFKAQDVWIEVRLSLEANRPRAARMAAAILGAEAEQAVAEALEQPARLLKRLRSQLMTPARAEAGLLALLRTAADDAGAAATLLETGAAGELPAEHAAWAWATIGRLAAMRQLPDAAEYYARAFTALGRRAPGWSDETLAWGVRAALRHAPQAGDRWGLVLRVIGAMSQAEQQDPAWVYWKARAQQARARRGEAGEADRQAASEQLAGIAEALGFYGLLAQEDLGRPIALPARPLPLSDAEREAARANPGLVRGLQLIGLGLRNEGVREWNWTLRGMADRELLAAAQFSCERQVWDRCINTSERSRAEIDSAQRYPMPYREEALAKAKEVGVDPAFVYGLMRQESRFITDTRSHVGASGLMQLMPATARWTARRVGLAYKPEMINDREVNLLLGMSYLKTVLEDFEGRQALAAAAYNAGPGRSRRWREGPPVEAAAWAETIPFNETRDYVKKVLANAVVYSAVIGAPAPSLKARLGGTVGPRDSRAPAPDRDIP